MTSQGRPELRIVAILPKGSMFDRMFEESIHPTVAGMGFHLRRVTADFTTPEKLTQAIESVRESDVLFAEITGRSSQVFYLIGWAHSLNKAVILSTHSTDDVPFAESGRAMIIHAGVSRELSSELRSHLHRMTNGAQAGCTPGSLQIPTADPAAKFRALYGDLLAEHGHEHRGAIRLENETTFVLENQEMELALVQALARRSRELGFRLKLL